MSTICNEEFMCPLCGKKFESVVQCSYSIFGTNLDFKRVGAAIIPTPTLQCPACGFVFFQNTFNDKELSKLREILKTQNIFQIKPNMPRYYYLAKEYELANRTKDEIITQYINAIWQTNSKSDLKAISEILFSYFSTIEKTDKNYYAFQFMKLDFLRRLGDFSNAKYLLQQLYDDNDLILTDSIEILFEYQEELINKCDTDEHQLPKTDKKTRDKNEFIDRIRIELFIDDAVNNKTIAGIQEITKLKTSRLLYRINNKLPILILSIHSGHHGNLITILKYLKLEIVEVTLVIRNTSIKIKLSDIDEAKLNEENLKELLYKIAMGT
ncbi:hypothetical protein AGMMS50212_05530 [Spirochaetia bacterium]|nr:hypothetical protein AGMMS50212_05530 [Spirochaetia bacterium]